MSVRKRKEKRREEGDKEYSWWETSFMYGPPGARRRCKESCKGARNRSEALAYETRRKAELERTMAAPAGKVPTFEDFAKEFLTACKASNKPSEIESKEAILRLYLVEEFGKLMLDRVGARQIAKAKAEWLELATPKTVNNRLTVLNKLLTTAKEFGLIAVVPKIAWCRVEEQELDFYTAEESARLLDAAEPGTWRTMILVGLRAGLRRGELLALRRVDCDLVNGKLVIRKSITRGHLTDTKGKRKREVPMSAELAAALHVHLTSHERELVFPAEPDGRHLTKGELRWPFRRACRKAGLREIGWHGLRHSFASQLVANNVSLKTVQELLGHQSIKTTMVYAHLAPVTKREAVAVLDTTKAIS